MQQPDSLGWEAVLGDDLTRLLAGSVVALAWLATVGAVHGRIVKPQIRRPGQGAYEEPHPPSAHDQVCQRATQQSPPLPLSLSPSEQWMPERRVYVPELERELIVPGYYERRLCDQGYAVASLPAYDPSSGTTVTIPGGERPAGGATPGPVSALRQDQSWRHSV
jgi:hypothetical protein